MHIVMIGPRRFFPTPLAGLDFYAHHLVSLLKKQETQVTVYTHACWDLGTVDKDPFLTIIPVWTLKKHHWDTFIYSLLATLKALKYRLAIFHYHGGSALFSFIPRLFGRKVVVTLHSMESKSNPFFKMAEWIGMQSAHQCVAVSKTLQDYLEGKYHRKIAYCPYGISKQSSNGSDVISSLGLKPKGYLLSLGRIAKGKGIEELVQAFKALQLFKRGLKLVIAGDMLYPSSYLKKMTQHTSDGILFLGRAEGILKGELFAQALLYLQASKKEGVSIALLEALSYGCPVLVSDIPQNREVVGDKNCLFETGNVDDLKIKLTRLLENLRGLEARGRKIQEEALKIYHETQPLNRMLEIYDPCQKKTL